MTPSDKEIELYTYKLLPVGTWFKLTDKYVNEKDCKFKLVGPVRLSFPDHGGPYRIQSYSNNNGSITKGLALRCNSLLGMLYIKVTWWDMELVCIRPDGKRDYFPSYWARSQHITIIDDEDTSKVILTTLGN